MSDAITQNLSPAALIATSWAKTLTERTDMSRLDWKARREYVRKELEILDPTEGEIHAIVMELGILVEYSPPPANTAVRGGLWE